MERERQQHAAESATGPADASPLSREERDLLAGLLLKLGRYSLTEVAAISGVDRRALRKKVPGDLDGRQHRPGGPRKLADPAVREELLQLLRSGCSRADAAAYIGVNQQTVRNEIKRDPVFAAAVKRATLSGKVLMVKRFAKGSKDDWRAAAEFLARKWPDEWGKKTPDSVTPEMLASVVTRIAAAMFPHIPRAKRAKVRAEVESIIASMSSRVRSSTPDPEPEPAKARKKTK
jgi:hypothetical protein